MPSIPRTINELVELYLAEGQRSYGEGVTQVAHALQCAALAREAQASDSLITAALFHDVGHLISGLQANDGFDFGVTDDLHEVLGAAVLRPLFGEHVSEPVRLHVAAKRWLCTTSTTYYAGLSATSQKTLVAQGGLMSPEECAHFEAEPFASDAVDLRRWDDAGKEEHVNVPGLLSWLPMLQRLSALV